LYFILNIKNYKGVKQMSTTSRILKTGSNQITQAYKKGVHNGIDIVKNKLQCDDLIAHSDGTVVLVQTGHKNNKLATGMSAYGNCVKIDHGNGYYTLYAHMANVKVKKGDKVKKGQVLGYMGNTGHSFGAHVHFEVFNGSNKIDPTPYINADLPVVEKDESPKALYKVYTGKWLSEIENYNTVNSMGYAGIQGKSMTSLAVRSNVGTLKYRVHIIDGKKSRWLGWVNQYNIKDSTYGYAGIKGKEIDAVQMKLEGTNDYSVKYRVSPKNSKTWYGWCTNTTNNAGDGYAGVMGQPIDCIQVSIVKK
jgi:hypothetical protein